MVRVFASPAEVEAIAQDYLASEKYFRFEMDYALDMNVLPVERTNYSSVMRAVLGTQACLITMNHERFNPESQQEATGEQETSPKTAKLLVGQLFFFEDVGYEEQVPRRDKYARE